MGRLVGVKNFRLDRRQLRATGIYFATVDRDPAFDYNQLAPSPDRSN
ncbi:hypothetical protein [Chamaesiphon sp. VAR_69_metabat_338]|nr:hypothetical protein [Chamaesiphon sp. VAR_69_metabat_338]